MSIKRLHKDVLSVNDKLSLYETVPKERKRQNIETRKSLSKEIEQIFKSISAELDEINQKFKSKDITKPDKKLSAEISKIQEAVVKTGRLNILKPGSEVGKKLFDQLNTFRGLSASSPKNPQKFVKEFEYKVNEFSEKINYLVQKIMVGEITEKDFVKETNSLFNYKIQNFVQQFETTGDRERTDLAKFRKELSGALTKLYEVSLEGLDQNLCESIENASETIGNILGIKVSPDRNPTIEKEIEILEQSYNRTMIPSFIKDVNQLVRMPETQTGRIKGSEDKIRQSMEKIGITTSFETIERNLGAVTKEYKKLTNKDDKKIYKSKILAIFSQIRNFLASLRPFIEIKNDRSKLANEVYNNMTKSYENITRELDKL